MYKITGRLRKIFKDFSSLKKLGGITTILIIIIIMIISLIIGSRLGNWTKYWINLEPNLLRKSGVKFLDWYDNFAQFVDICRGKIESAYGVGSKTQIVHAVESLVS